LAEQSTQTLDGFFFTSTLEPFEQFVFIAEKNIMLQKNFNPADSKK